MGLCYRTLCFHHKILRTQQNKPSGDILRYVLLKENPIKPFFFFSLAYKESAAVIDWWVSATFFSLRTDMQHFGTKAFLQLSLLCEGWERGETVSVFFFIFFFFFASSSDMASLGGGVSPSESFHPHQGSRAVTTGIRLITHSPRRLHK